jgi:T5orf172 domain
MSWVTSAKCYIGIAVESRVLHGARKQGFLLAEIFIVVYKRCAMPEIIYILINEAMPDLVKIGLTNSNLEERIRQLNGATGVPLPFECVYAVEVDNAAKVEKTLHALFSENRINPKREFFRVAHERVRLALSLGNFREVTPGSNIFESVEESEAVAKASARRSRIQLEALGIQVGDVLTFYRDESRVAVVEPNNKILFEGQSTSLSEAASRILAEKTGKSTVVSGSDYWMYKGEILWELRLRLEENA